VVEELRRACGLELGGANDRTRHIIAEHTRVAGVMGMETKSEMRALRDEVARRLTLRGVDVDAEELARLVLPHERLYALADHARTLPMMLADGVVPSNVKAGYLARLLVRRGLRLIEELECPSSCATSSRSTTPT